MEKFSLKWNDFSLNVHNSFQNLRKEEDFYDITLVGDDCKNVTAHKLVLSSSSEYFKMVFSNNKKYFQSHALICLEGLNESDLNNILDYIYYGELQLYRDDLDRFLGIAERLKLEGLILEDPHMDEDVSKAKHVLQENVLTSVNNNLLVSDGENKMSKNVEGTLENRKTWPFLPEKPVISVDCSDIQNIEDLNQKVEESYSKDSHGFHRCHYCEKTFKLRANMKQHVEVHFKGLIFNCQFCDTVLTSRKSLRSHKKRKHNS